MHCRRSFTMPHRILTLLQSFILPADVSKVTEAEWRVIVVLPLTQQWRWPQCQNDIRIFVLALQGSRREVSHVCKCSKDIWLNVSKLWGQWSWGPLHLQRRGQDKTSIEQEDYYCNFLVNTAWPKKLEMFLWQVNSLLCAWYLESHTDVILQLIYPA